MDLHRDKIRIWSVSILLSAIVHLLILFPLAKLGGYHFAKPVTPLQAVMVDLKGPSVDTVSVKEAAGREATETATDAADAEDEEGAASADTPLKGNPPGQAEHEHESAKNSPAINTGEADASMQSKESTAEIKPVTAPEKMPGYAIKPPLRTAGEFMTTGWEKLTYQVSMLGLPVGIAELEAINERGDVLITLRVKSTSALSSLYPVDDLVETRHIGGNFIITKIKQQEGSFKRDRGFTLFLREQSVFWIDNLRKRSMTEPIPNSEVLDLLSAVYFLRNRQLKVGSTELLHVYDCDTYSALPVKVMRQEQISLPGFRKAQALVVKPLLKTDGIFKRAGELLIWLTDDENKVPVKVETQIALGKVTVELVSAETQRHGKPPARGDTARRKADQ